jgi:translation initiation factor IF-3
MPTAEALQMAREKGLDLVEVAPNAVPPVARLLDYGRFKYEQEKKDREARKNQKIVLLKEVRLRPKTDEHDVDFKSKRIERFIEEGDKVKVTLRFRGREMAHPNLGRQLLEEVADRVKNVAVVERMPLMEGNTMTMILTRGKQPAAGQRPAAEQDDGDQQPAPARSAPPAGQAAPARPPTPDQPAPARPPAPAQQAPEQPPAAGEAANRPPAAPNRPA